MRMHNDELLDVMQEQYDRLLAMLQETAAQYARDPHHESPVMTTLVDMLLHQALPMEMKTVVDRHVLEELGVDSLDHVSIVQYDAMVTKVLSEHGSEITETAWSFLIISVFLTGQKFQETILSCNCLENEIDNVHTHVENWRKDFNEREDEAGRDGGRSSPDTDDTDG
jgi:ribosomal protein S15P/S13E